MMEIDFYEMPSGKCPVIIKIKELDIKIQKKIIKRIENLKTENINELLKVEIVKKLEDNLFELRPYGYRLTFIVHKNQYKILTIFKKQGNKTPKKEIEKAKNLKKLIKTENC